MDHPSVDHDVYIYIYIDDIGLFHLKISADELKKKSDTSEMDASENQASIAPLNSLLTKTGNMMF